MSLLSRRSASEFDARWPTIEAVRGQLATGHYDAAAWEPFLEQLRASSVVERKAFQDRANTLVVNGFNYNWIESLFRYDQKFGHGKLTSLSTPPIFQVLSSLYLHTRPNPDSMAVIETAMKEIAREEVDVLFGFDPWCHNLAQSFWEYTKGEARLQSYPWNLTIPIADLCNARCSFCTSWLDGRALISMEQLESLREVIERAVFVGLVGHGEPLAHPKFPDIADKLAGWLDPRATLYTITNGFLINRLFEKLNRIKVRSYSISLNAASPQTHDRVMALGPRAFEEVISGIRKLHKLRASSDAGLQTYITMVVTSENVHEIADFVRLGNDLDVTGIWIRSLLPQPSLIPGLNYHTLPPTLNPDFERHRERAVDAIVKSAVPVQADPSAWSNELFSPAIKEEIKRNPPSLIPREVARRDHDLHDRNAHLYDIERGRLRGGRKGNAAGTSVSISSAGIDFTTSDLPYSYAVSLPLANPDASSGRAFSIELAVARGKVGVGLLDVAANKFLERQFLDAGFDGAIALTAPEGPELQLIVENGAPDSASKGTIRRVTVRPATEARPGEETTPPAETEVSLLAISVHNATDPLEDGLNPLNRVPRFACKAVYYNLYVNEMFFRVNPCCFMQEVPGFDEVRFEDGRPFMEAWNSPAFIELRTRLRDGPLFAACRRCPEKW